MQDNRNISPCLSNDTKGMVCIDTKRVLDACRDRDCFEDVRVYLGQYGEEILKTATNIRTKSAKIAWVCVSVNEVPFNDGFYQVNIRYFIEVVFEACVAIGRSQTFRGLLTVEKDVVLYGGEGNITSYSSTPGANFCDACSTTVITNRLPSAVVEALEPMVLGTKVCEVGSGCGCCCCCCDAIELPSEMTNYFDEPLVMSQCGLELRVSIGLFSIIRLERPSQLLIQASDYCVPDKECISATNNDNPCDLFNSIAFPVARFKTALYNPAENAPRGGCGCGK